MVEEEVDAGGLVVVDDDYRSQMSLAQNWLACETIVK